MVRLGELPRHARSFQDREKLSDAFCLISTRLKRTARVLCLLTTWIGVAALVLFLCGALSTHGHKPVACTGVHW